MAARRIASTGPNRRIVTTRRRRAFFVVAHALHRSDVTRWSSGGVALCSLRSRSSRSGPGKRDGPAMPSAIVPQNFRKWLSADMVLWCCSGLTAVPAVQRAFAASLCNSPSVPAFGQYCRHSGSSGVSKRSRLASLLADAARTQPLHIARRGRIVLGQRVGIQMQHGHSIQQQFRRVGPELRHMTQIVRRKAYVSRNTCNFRTIARVQALAALADQLALTHPLAKRRNE